MIAVSNAGPLIACAKIRQFDLLHQLFDELVIPNAVYDEVVVKGATRAGAEETQAALNHWIRVAHVQHPALPRSLHLHLGSGEAEAIALAAELAASYLLLDDRKARLTARYLGMPVVGTVGIMQRAHRDGLLPDLKQALDDLRAAGFRISDQVYWQALQAK
jgi:predicted nucleic acid-binding protein